MSANEHDDDQADTADVIERLRAENADYREVAATLESEIAGLKAENGAFRDALEWVASTDAGYDAIQRAARAALTRKPAAP